MGAITLIWQDLRALNDYYRAGYQISFWRTAQKLEVDLVLYGPKGLFAIEVKRGDRLRPGDLDGLSAFLADYPEARALVVYTGTRTYHERGIDVIPLDAWFGREGYAHKTFFSTSRDGHD